ncbi:sugar MFS transporter [Halocola ammonii]
MTTPNSTSRIQRTIALIAVTTLFFMWGFITSMNDILIPEFKGDFNLTYFQSFLVQTAFFGAYFVGSVIYFLISIRTGDPIARIGYKNGMLTGLLISGAGCFLFIPAAANSSYELFLGALFVLGLGLTLLQICCNPYVSILGPEESAASRLNTAQAFNSLGTTLAPLIGGYFIFQYFFDSTQSAGASVKIPYIVLGGVFVLMAIILWFITLPKMSEEDSIPSSLGAFKFRHLRLGMLAIFVYVGAEVAIGSSLISYYDELLGIPEKIGTRYLAFYWGGAMIGRFAGAIFLSRLSLVKKLGAVLAAGFGATYLVFEVSGLAFEQIFYFVIFLLLNFGAFFLGKFKADKTLSIFSVISAALLLVALVTESYWALWAVTAIGLFNSIMWSNIFTLAIRGLGKYTAQGSSLLVMMVVGGAIIPMIQGGLADHFGLQQSFGLLILLYIYLFYYGWRGSKITDLSKSRKHKSSIDEV